MQSLDDPYHSWQVPGVAHYMRDLTTLELDPKTYHEHPPFRHFLNAMRGLGELAGLKLVDAGCGVGHYSELVARHFPGVVYAGFDFSEEMVAVAKELWPGREFFVADMVDFDYSPYDVVLASSLIEVMDDWAKGSEAMCATARKIILHRVRIHQARTERRNTGGYPQQSTYTHYHNEGELVEFYEARGFDVVWYEHWTEFPQATYIFERA
jgi:SAM-dependent methyltransferase